MIGSASTVNSSSLKILNPSADIVISSSTALLTSIAILITNENISKLKLRYTKLRDWINIIEISYEKAINQPILDKKTR